MHQFGQINSTPSVTFVRGIEEDVFNSLSGYYIDIDSFDCLDKEGATNFAPILKTLNIGDKLEYFSANEQSSLYIERDDYGYVGLELRNNGYAVAPIGFGSIDEMVEFYLAISNTPDEDGAYSAYGFLHNDGEEFGNYFSFTKVNTNVDLATWYENMKSTSADSDDEDDTPSDEEDDTPSEDTTFRFIESLNLTPEFKVPRYIGDTQHTSDNGYSFMIRDIDNEFDFSGCVDVFEYAERVMNGEEFEFVAPNGTSKFRIYNDRDEVVAYTCEHNGNAIDVTTLDIESLRGMISQLRELYAGYLGFAHLGDDVVVYQLTYMRSNKEDSASISFAYREGLTEWYESLGNVESGGNDAPSDNPDNPSSGDTPSNPPSDNPTQPDDKPNDDYEFEDYEKPIPSSMKEYFWADNVAKDLLITDGDVSVVDGKLKVENYKVKLTNSEIHQEEFSLIESLTDEDTLTFGEASSAVCEFTFSGNVISLKGMRLKVYMYLDRNPENMIRIGEYIVESDTPTADRMKRQVTMYDDLSRVINSDVASWYKGISYPITLRAFASSFFAHFGIIIDNNEDLINGEMMLKKATISPEVLSGKDVLTCILQAFGCCGRIGRNGHFQFVYLPQSIKGKYPAIDLYPREDLFPQKPKGEYISKATYIPPCEYESYTVESITQLEIRDSDNAIGTTVGVAGNPYVIEGNFLFYGMTDGTRRIYAQNILGKIEKVMYVPFSVDIKGNPCVEVGDAIRLNTTYDKVDSYVLHRRLHGIQGLRDSISSKGTQYQEQKVNDLSTKLKSTEGKVTTQIETLIDGMAIRIDEDGKIVTSAEIKASGIDFRSEKFCVDSKNFTLNEDGDVWFRGNITGSTISGGVLTNTESDNGEIKIERGKITQTRQDYSTELSSGKLKVSHSDGYYTEISGKVRVSDSPLSKADSWVQLDDEGLKIIVGGDVFTEITDTSGKINGKTIITSGNIGQQSVHMADVANSCTLSDGTYKMYSVYDSFPTNNYVYINSYGNFVPNLSGTMRCGGSQGKWSEVWAENGTIQTSDRNLKHDIEDVDERYVEFITKLMPKRFKMNSGTSGRFHMGFIAQDVEELLAECGIETTEFAGLIKDVYKDDDGNDVEYYALRYSEFIAPLVTAWQRTEDKLNNLISTLKDKGVL